MPNWVAAAQTTLNGDEPIIAPGLQCETPFTCPFFVHCNPDALKNKAQLAYPPEDLPQHNGLAAQLREDGYDDLRQVPNGGVLFALPALLAMGLLKYTERFFKLPKGYYGLDSLFLLLAFMAFTRLQSIEKLRYCAPGEWGKLLGLDRIPEARTLRNKVQLLTDDNQAKGWSAEMCSYRMELAPEQAKDRLLVQAENNSAEIKNLDEIESKAKTVYGKTPQAATIIPNYENLY